MASVDQKVSGEKKKGFPCHNDGCAEISANRMARCRHMKKCLFAPKTAIPPAPKTMDHFDYNPVSGSYTCKKCSVVVKHRNNLNRHPSKCKGTPKQNALKCSSCTKEFAFKSKLVEHQKVHKNESFTCMYCCKVIKSESNFNRHIIKCSSLPKETTDPATFQHRENSHVELEESSVTSAQWDSSLYSSEDFALQDTASNDISLTSIIDTNLCLNSTAASYEVEDTSIMSVEPPNDSLDLQSIIPDANHSQRTSSPRLKQYRNSKEVNRKSLIVDGILAKVEQEQRERILKRSMGEQMTKFADATMNFFCDLIREGRKSQSGMARANYYLLLVFKDEIWNEHYQQWLVKALKLRDHNELLSFLLYEKSDETRGRKMLPLDLRQEIYDFWKANSELSIYRSNGRHIAKIDKSNILPQHNDIVDNETSDLEKNPNKLQAHRKFVDIPYRVLHKIFNDNHRSCSFASFINMKPFYISPVTTKEMESCLCITCLNFHCLYSAIRRNVKRQLPHSISEYLCETVTCPKDDKIGFHDIKCINGKCENHCKARCVADDLKVEIKEANRLKNNIHYYQFEKITTFYHNTVGKKVSYDRTGRVDRKASLEEIVKKLQAGALGYLQHRYLYKNDTFYWKKFLAETDNPVIWIDYSQNLAFKERKQAQSANYSGVQQTLHNTLLQMPHGGERKYIYHLSDDTNHDSVLTFAILEDITNKYPKVIINKKLLIQSENCKTQYKRSSTSSGILH